MDRGSGEKTKAHDISELNEFYVQGDSCDQEIFAEQRSNLLLVSGEHYNRRRQNLARRLRDYKDVSQEQKIRLTKNHIQKICKTYVNNIMSMEPGVGFSPKDQKSVHDQKVADLDHSIWMDGRNRFNIDDLMDDWCDNFVEVGEVAVKVFFDPSAGKIVAHEQKVDVEGQPMLGPDGQPQGDPSRPVFSGEFVFEEVYGFNLLRPPECKDMRKAEWICIRKMVGKADLTAKFGHDEESKRFIVASADETYTVFDGTRGGYRQTDKEVMVREYYFRACAKYPQGYYYITTKEGILSQGELPGGVFPIIFQPFDKVQTTSRGRSVVKILRPYQAEINRAASKMAEHQITLGDDKLVLLNGGKASPSVSLPGVRTISATGGAPIVMEGRSGAQYLEYMQSQIAEMYQVSNVAEDTAQIPGQLDPYTLLFRSAKNKKQFQRYIKRFEKFLIEIVKTYLKLAKIHMSDEQLTAAIGKDEQVNIAEIRGGQDDAYDIKIEGQSDDIESKLGQQIFVNHAIQYLGSQLDKQEVGKLLRMAPLANFKGSFDDLTSNDDIATNDILALDRGERPPVHEFEDHPYMIKRLMTRSRKPDFGFLDPQIQKNYQEKMQIHQQMEAYKQLQIQQAAAGYIPTGGYLAKCDVWISDPKNPTQTHRLELPSESINWLMTRMQAQQGAMAPLAGLPTDAQAGIASNVTQLKARAGQPAPQQPGSPNGMEAPSAQMGPPEPGGMSHGVGHQQYNGS